jgi:hypothetical protein
MRRFGLIALTAALVVPGCGSSSSQNPSQQPVVFTAQLRTGNEVPPISNTTEANAQGTVTITFNVPRDSSGNPTGDGTWNVQAVVSGFPDGSQIRAAHIHNGAAGVQAGVFVDTGQLASNPVPLPGGSATINYTNVPITQSQAAAVMANPAGHYFNMHSILNPGGVIRGQLTRQ